MHDLATLDTAGPDDVSLFSDDAYRQAAETSRAGAMITTPKLGGLMPDGIGLLYVADPRLAFALVSGLFYPRGMLEPGIRATAMVDPSAVIGEGSQIDAGVNIGRDVAIGRGCHIEANALIDEGVTLGDGCSSVPAARSVMRSSVRGSASAAIPASAARDLASCRQPPACCA